MASLSEVPQFLASGIVKHQYQDFGLGVVAWYGSRLVLLREVVWVLLPKQIVMRQYL